MYINKYFNTYQYEFNNPDSLQAWYLVHRYDTLGEYSLFGQMQKGPDGRIYSGKHAGSYPYNNVINKPNIKGPGCDFCQFCLDFSFLNNVASTSPPNMPDFNLGPRPGPCWPLSNDEVLTLKNLMEVYPNPSSNKVFIKTSLKDRRELFDALGQLVISTNDNEINVSYLSAGIYYLKCGNIAVKVIVE